MPLSRRSILAASALAPAALLLPHAAKADGDPRLGERTLGSPDAKVVVNEWFSLTCTHCAEFQRTTFPQVRKAKLIDTGRVRYVWKRLTRWTRWR